MKKFSIILSILILLGFLPISVSAETDIHTLRMSVDSMLEEIMESNNAQKAINSGYAYITVLYRDTNNSGQKLLYVIFSQNSVVEIDDDVYIFINRSVSGPMLSGYYQKISPYKGLQVHGVNEIPRFYNKYNNMNYQNAFTHFIADRSTSVLKGIFDLETSLEYIVYLDGNQEAELSKLKSLIRQAELLNENDFDPNSWNSMQAVLEDAKSLLISSPSQQEVDDMCDRLQEALDNLVRIPTGNTYRINDEDPRITYSDNWTYQADASFYNGDKHFTNIPVSYAELTFTGPYVAWIGAMNANQGTADVYIDGVLDTSVNLYSSTAEVQKEIYSRDDLSAGTHTIRIVNTSTRYINIDAFDVEDTDAPPVDTHTVTVTTRYQDNAMPEETKTYQVEDGAAFNETFEILDGYGVYSGRFRTATVWGIDEINRTITIDPVERDYSVEIEFYKLEETNDHTVTVILQFDDGSSDIVSTYTAVAGSEFSQQFAIPAGYTYQSYLSDNMDVYILRAENRIVIDSVEQDTTVTIKLV